MFGNIGSNLPILVQVTFKYALSMRDGYVVLQPERMQRGHEPVADYVVTGINILVMACCQESIVVDLRLTSKVPYQLSYISIR
jgi:hypothetical protein